MSNTSRFDKHVTVTRLNSYEDHSWVVNLTVEEPDALMCARPDLWEPWAGNCPGPPGQTVESPPSSESAISLRQKPNQLRHASERRASVQQAERN